MDTVLITGAATGIGKATALSFAADGFNVAVHYNKSEEAALTLCADIAAQGGRALAVRADVSDAAQVKKMVQRVIEVFGHIDVLVNNAGIAQSKLFTDLTADDWNTMFDVNVKGVFHCCQSVLPGMISRKSGCIVNVSSIWGLVGASCEVHYSAAKAAVIGLAKALAKELGPSGIRVNAVAPGVIDTGMIAGLNDETREALKEETPLCRLGTAEDVAQTIRFLASENAGFITGQVISPNGGFVI
jgi:3-oxoacyl-[acyl-carrier protein] reductase